MVEYRGEQLDRVFRALADGTRRSILEQLRKGPATVSDLAAPHEITLQGISKHLKKLDDAGLIRRRKEGREVWCELEAGPLASASSWIVEQRRFWEPRLDRLESHLQKKSRIQEKKQRGQDDGSQSD